MKTKDRLRGMFAKENLPGLIKRVGSLTALYMLYSLVSSISTVNLFSTSNARFLPEVDSNIIGANARLVLSLIYSLFILSTFVNALMFYQRRYLEEFIDRQEYQGRFYKRYAYVLRSDDFWITCVVLSFWNLVFPLRNIIASLGRAVYNESYFSIDYLSVLLNVPLIFLAVFITYTSALSWVEIKCAKRSLPAKKSLGKLIWQLTYSSVGFIITAVALPIVCLAVYATVLILGVFAFSLPMAALTVLLVYLSLKYGRGLMARRRFMKSLKRICKENRYRLTNVRKIYSSLFFGQEGSNFTVEADGTAYTCKILGIPHRKTPIYLNEQGEASYSHKMFFLVEHISTLNYFFESDKKFDQNSVKILVIIPDSQRVYAEDAMAKRKLELGDKVMDCRVYHASGFANALERRCILK